MKLLECSPKRLGRCKWCLTFSESVAHKPHRFKLAELSLKYILDAQAQERRDKIKAHIEHVKSRQTTSVFSALMQIYEDLFNKHLPLDETKRPDAIATAEKILSWVFVSVRPLSRDEVISLAHDKFEEEYAAESIDVVCRNFIFESEAGMIRISHSSVRDYLAVRISHKSRKISQAGPFTYNKTLDEAYDIVQRLAHTRIVKESIQYLLSTNHIHIKETEPKATIALLRYIAHNWHIHTKLSTDNIAELPEELRESIFPMFEKENEQAFSNWRRFYDPDSLDIESSKRYQRNFKPPEQLYCTVSLDLFQIADLLIDSKSILLVACLGRRCN